MAQAGHMRGDEDGLIKKITKKYGDLLGAVASMGINIGTFPIYDATDVVADIVETFKNKDFSKIALLGVLFGITAPIALPVADYMHTVVHESGHALAYKTISKKWPEKFVIGLSPKKYDVRRIEKKIYFRMPKLGSLWIGDLGAFSTTAGFIERFNMPYAWQEAITHIAGPIAGATTHIIGELALWEISRALKRGNGKYTFLLPVFNSLRLLNLLSASIIIPSVFSSDVPDMINFRAQKKAITDAFKNAAKKMNLMDRIKYALSVKSDY